MGEPPQSFVPAGTKAGQGEAMEAEASAVGVAKAVAVGVAKAVAEVVVPTGWVAASIGMDGTLLRLSRVECKLVGVQPAEAIRTRVRTWFARGNFGSAKGLAPWSRMSACDV